MDILIPVFFALFAAAIFGTVFTVRKRRQRARSLAFEALAARMGLRYSPDDSFGLLRQLRSFRLFHREGRSFIRPGQIRNVLQGRVGATEVYLFDYTYLIVAGNTVRRISQTVFFANDKDWYLPNFQLRPETWWRKLQALFDKSDINFPESPEFSGKFWLSGDFESLIRKTFRPEVQHFLINRPPVHLEGDNYYLLAYKPRKPLNVDEAEVFFEHCCQLVSMLQQPEGKMELLNLAELEKREADPVKREK